MTTDDTLLELVEPINLEGDEFETHAAEIIDSAGISPKALSGADHANLQHAIAATIRRLQGEVEELSKDNDRLCRDGVDKAVAWDRNAAKNEDIASLQSKLSEAKELLTTIRANMYEASRKLPEPMCSAFGDLIDAIDSVLSPTNTTPDTEKADLANNASAESVFEQKDQFLEVARRLEKNADRHR